MVLLIEQERILASEVNYWNVASHYPFPTSSYGSIFSAYCASIAGLVVYTFSVRNADSVSRTFQVRMKVGGNVFFATGAAVTLGAGASVTYAGILYLTAGDYDVLFEGVCSAGTLVYFENFQIGKCSFIDLTGAMAAPYTTALPTSTVVRGTPIGPIAYSTIYVQVGASTPGEVTNMESAGETLTNGVRIKVNTAAQTWTSRFQDSDAGALNGASGMYIFQGAAGTNYSITIEKTNAASVVNVSVVACPWIMPIGGAITASLFPVALTFPQGSTLYCNLEPLFLDPTKYFLIGKKRAVSFGDASDYYYYPSGTGVLACAFTFEIPDVASVSVFAYGWGGCINQIGVDTK
jgi:hypothetical protein